MAVMTEPAVLCVCITNLIDVLLPVLLIHCKTLVMVKCFNQLLGKHAIGERNYFSVY